MKHFVGIVHQDPGSAYGIQFPDVPGCFSAADDLDDLPARAREALSLWFEDAAPVEPRSLAELRKDPDVRDAMGEDGFFRPSPWHVDHVHVRFKGASADVPSALRFKPPVKED